jgi:hypothetical protein
MNQTKSDMEGRPSRIDTPKGHRPPKAIAGTEPKPADITDLLPDGQTDPTKIAEERRRRMDEQTRDAKQPKREGPMSSLKRKADQKITQWIIAILMLALRKIRDIAIDTFLSFGVYVKDENGNPVPKLDDKGNPILRDGKPVYRIAWGSTFLALLAKWRGEIAFLGAWLGYQIGGLTVFEWLERIAALLGV